MPAAKLTQQDRADIKRRWARGETQRSLSVAYGVTEKTIYCACHDIKGRRPKTPNPGKARRAQSNKDLRPLLGKLDQLLDRLEQIDQLLEDGNQQQAQEQLAGAMVDAAEAARQLEVKLCRGS